MPEVGEAGSSQLPELDFAGLSVSKLEALPATVPSANGDKKMTRKAKLEQIRLQKSEELRKKDPEAWEKKERERKETEEAKRLAKREKQKEKNKARKAAQKEKREAEAANGTEATSISIPRPAPVPARPSKTAVALGLANSSEPSTTPVASTSRQQQPAFTSNGSRPNPPSSRFPRPPPSGAPPVDYTRAREAYTQRLATDPAYIPKVGKFWGHDDRLASPEVRPLNPFWRGGRGGAGTRGRGGAVRGGRGGFAAPRGPDRWTADGKVAGEDEESQVAEKEIGDEVAEQKPKELDPEDKWGRGESKRAPKPSEFAAMPGWNHAGFEELEREEEERAARGPSPSIRGAKRGGRGGARGRGGFAGRGGLNQGPPGAINPRYAHLPFHPLHRFPPSTLPATQTTQSTTSSVTSEPQPSTEASPAAESSTTVESTTVLQVTSPNRPGNVRLPSSGVAAAQFALAVKEATASRPTPEESIPESIKPEVQAQPEGDETPAVVPHPPAATSPSLELRRQQGASILYAADPSRLANSVPREDAVSPASSFSAYQQQMEPTPMPPHNPYQHQLPPHLQSQAAFIPRHSSPSFYPNAAPPPPSFYPIDSYGSMSSPSSATPPPQHFSSPPTSSFFLPPRSSRVEIKNPSSPAPARQTVVSTNNTAYAIASQQDQQQQQLDSASPASAQGNVPLPPTSPSHLHQQYYQNPYSSATPPPMPPHAPYGYSHLQHQPPSSFSPLPHYEMNYYQQYSQPPPPPPQSYSYYPQNQQQYAPY